MRKLALLVLVLLCLPAFAQGRKVFPLVNPFAHSQPFLVQSITTNPWAAYSTTRRLSSTYSGSAFRVKRSSDATTLDVGFVDGRITDTNALMTFVGATGSGYLNILYDQSGNARDMGTLTCGSPSTNCAPLLVINGTMQTDESGRVTAYVRDTSRDIKTAVSVPALPVSMFGVFQNVTGTSGNSIFGTGNGVNQTSFVQISNYGVGINNGTALNAPGSFCWNTLYLASLYFQTGTSDSIQINDYANTTTTGTAGDTAPSAANFGDASTGNSADSKIDEFIIWNITLSAADRAIVQGNITNFYTFRSLTCGSNTLNTSLMAYWKLDETSGSRADAQDSQTLTDNNTVTSNPGIISNAGQFVLANAESLSIADDATMSTGDIDFTFTCWVYFDTITPAFDKGILGKMNAVPNNYEYFLRYLTDPTSRFQFGVSSDGTVGNLKTVLANNFGLPVTNTWYFLVAAHDSVNNLISIQVNNGTANTTATSAGVFDGANSFKIGVFAAPSYWDGRIDEVGFWKKILTAAEITELYNSGAGKTCCPFQ